MDKNKNINKYSKEKVGLEYNLEVERKDKENLKKSGYDFVPRFNEWLSISGSASVCRSCE